MHVVYGLPTLKTHAKSHPDRPPRGRRRAPLRPRRDRQLPPEDRAPVHGLRPAHLRRRDRRPTSPTCSTSSPASRARALRGACSSPPPTCATAIIAEIDRTIEAKQAGQQVADPDEDELARRQALHPRALPRLARRRPRRPQHPRHLLPAPGRPRRVGEHPRPLDRRPLPRALAHLRASSAATRRRSSSARPTSCRATSTRASSCSRRSATRRCAASSPTRWSAAWPTTRTRGCSAPTAPGRAASPAPTAPRNVQDELRAFHAERAAEAQAAAS